LVLLVAALAVAGLLAWYGFHAYNKLSGTGGAQIPTVKVAEGDVSLTVFARGEIRGGNSEQLTAPMTGDVDLHITYLRRNGDPVKPGDVVLEFDTTNQQYALREAESDLAEAKEHLRQATAQQQADQEEDRYALLKANTDIKLAELDVRKNPLLSAIVAKQNDLALAVARDRLAQLQQNLANRKATDEAGITVQQAAEGKAQTQATTARQNIQAMTVRARHAGYFSLKQNMSGNFFFGGMDLPLYQVGDQVHPGMAVAEIPDLTSWEVGANIGELDRGHLAVGDQVRVTAIPFPGHVFRAHVKDIGGTSGPPWDRRFECKVALDDPAPELRPGMSAQLEITTETMKNVLSLPAQAMFESDGKTFVYVRSGTAFVRKDVTLVRRNETRVVVKGLSAGQDIALVNPIEPVQKKAAHEGGPLEALPK
jgi:HlyD family secretion protein